MSSQVIKTWIIVDRPGIEPFKKQPMEGNETEMLKHLMVLHPDASLIVAQLAYGQDLWLTSGARWLSEAEALEAEIKAHKEAPEDA